MNYRLKLAALSAGTLLLAACASTGPEKVQQKAPAPTSSNERAPGELMSYIQQGECDTLGKRLDEGATLPAMDSMGYTPLGLASAYAFPQCIKVLVEHGANVNTPMMGGWTPIMLSAMSGASGPVLQLLLDKGADINAQNEWGCTALYYAVGYGAVPTVKYLLQHGAKNPGTGKGCMSPEKYAKIKGYPPIVKVLNEYSGSSQTPANAGGAQ
jgi:FOG: Ankyrin repeat